MGTPCASGLGWFSWEEGGCRRCRGLSGVVVTICLEFSCCHAWHIPSARSLCGDQPSQALGTVTLQSSSFLLGRDPHPQEGGVTGSPPGRDLTSSYLCLPRVTSVWWEFCGFIYNGSSGVCLVDFGDQMLKVFGTLYVTQVREHCHFYNSSFMWAQPGSITIGIILSLKKKHKLSPKTRGIVQSAIRSHTKRNMVLLLC
jgi:hypothetical protein